MSMDDPGWDTPGFDDGQAPDGWNEPAAPARGGSGSGGSGGSGGPPVWQNPKYLGIGGGAVALIIIIVLIILVAGGGGGSPKTTPTQQAAVTTSVSPTLPPSVSPSTSPSVTPTPKKTAAPKIETIDQYDKKADHLCTVYKPKLTHAENVSIGSFVRVANAEFKKIHKLKKPTSGAEDISRWLTDAKAALKDAKARNINAYNASILHADTFAGELGMHICNYGH
jgi:hypothetical protein